MTLHPPFWLQAQSPDADLTYSGFEVRNWLESNQRRTSGIINEQGCLASGSGIGFKVTQRGAGANFSVDVAAGRAIITDDDVTNGGPIAVWSDATVNVATPTAPASGTDNHRIIVRVRNKLENNTWSTYDFTPDIVPAVGGALQAEPPSAITLAVVQIAHGQASVQNANITDYRETCGPVWGYKASDTSRTNNATFANDPDLQLLNLAANAIYELRGSLVYTAGTGQDIKMQWVTTSAFGTYSAPHFNISNQWVNYALGLNTDVLHAQGQTTSQQVGIPVLGTIDTGNAPASVILQWCQDTSGSSPTVMKAGSYLEARRIS